MADHGTKKHKLLRALFGNRGRKKRMEKETEQKKRYAEHFKKAGPKYAKTYVEWVKGEKEPKGKKIAYYGQKRETADAILRRIKEGRLNR